MSSHEAAVPDIEVAAVQNAISNATHLASEARYLDALQLLGRAMNPRDLEGSTVERQLTACNLRIAIAEMYRYQGDFAEAAEVVRMMLPGWEEWVNYPEFGANALAHCPVKCANILVLATLHVAHESKENFEAAQEYLSLALEYQGIIDDDEKQDIAWEVNRLEMKIKRHDDFSKTVRDLRDYCQAMTNMQKEANEGFLQTLLDLGILFYQHKKYSGAKFWFSRALEKISAVKGAQHPMSAWAAFRLGESIQKESGYDITTDGSTTLDLYVPLVAIAPKSYGPESRYTVEAMLGWAKCVISTRKDSYADLELEKSDEFDRAVHTLHRVVDVCEDKDERYEALRRAALAAIRGEDSS